MTILATLCYLGDAQRILMLHRNKRDEDWHKGKYNGLGGKFLPGESPEACMRREVYEESGLRPLAWRLKGVLSFPGFDGENDWYCFLYRITEWEGVLTESPEGTLEWVDRDRLMQLPLWPGDRLFLPLLLQEEGWFEGELRYEQKRLVSWHLREYPSGKPMSGFASGAQE